MTKSIYGKAIASAIVSLFVIKSMVSIIESVIPNKNDSVNPSICSFE